MILQVDKLSKSYQQGQTELQILKQTSFSVAGAECVAILGQSGSGKTTLLSLLAGLDRGGGQIRMDEVLFSSLNEEEKTIYRGQNIGIIFQSYHLVPHLTALENVMLPLEIQQSSDAKVRAEEMLKRVGLEHRFDHFPTQLSGGECQRVAFARALAPKPRLLLADEPSGSLDQETGQLVMDLFFNLIREDQMTTILVTHDQNLANRCDRRLYLRHGELQE